MARPHRLCRNRRTSAASRWRRASPRSSGRRIHDEIAGLRYGADQPRDQVGRLRVRVDFGDQPSPATCPGYGDRAKSPSRAAVASAARANTAAPPAAMAVARPRIVPGDQINTRKDISNTEVVALAESERVASRASSSRSAATPALFLDSTDQYSRRSSAAVRSDLSAGLPRCRISAYRARSYAADRRTPGASSWPAASAAA